MKIARRFTRREDELDCRRVIRAALIQLLQAFQSMARARKLIAHSRELSFSVADSFMPTHNCIDRSFSLRLQTRYSFASIAKLLRKSLSFNLAFGMLQIGAFTFTRQPLCLLRQPFERSSK